jgi:hypothetical protein
MKNSNFPKFAEDLFFDAVGKRGNREQMLYRIKTGLIAAILCSVTIAQAAEGQKARLTESGGVFTEGIGTTAGLMPASCQPSKDTVVFIQQDTGAQAEMSGLDLDRILITNGACSGEEGWIDSRKLARG